MIDTNKGIDYSVKKIVQDVSIVKRPKKKRILWFLNIPVMQPTIMVDVTLYLEVSQPLVENDIILLDTGYRYLVVASNQKEFTKVVNLDGTTQKINISMNGKLSLLASSFAEGSLTPN